MRWKPLTDSPLRQYVLVFGSGDEVMAELLDFSREQELSAASLTGIGALSEATVAFFDPAKKDYDEVPIAEQTEVLSLIGNVALNEAGDRQLHLHVVLGKRDGTALGGHLLRAEVRPTLEVVLSESPPDLRRRSDEESGLALIDLGA
jgi:predicted DNA-binding protein with PD1-like motif